MDIQIAYEDDSMVAINKPAGVLVHSSHTSKGEPTLVDWFVKKYPQAKDISEMQTLADGSVIARPGVVHRLDKDTSGVLVFAKTATAYTALKEQFQNREVKKVYTALVYGVPRFEKLVIERPIAKHPKDFRRFTSKEGRGLSREATTVVTIIERFIKHAVLAVEPKTGRTHQIRVHLSDEGFPVVCDKLYARGRDCPALMRRQALHARSLELISPKTGQKVTILAPLAPDMVATIDNLRTAC